SYDRVPGGRHRLPSHPLLRVRLLAAGAVERGGPKAAHAEARRPLESLPAPGDAAAENELLVPPALEHRAPRIRRIQVLLEAAPSLMRETLRRATQHGAPVCPRSRSSSPR